MTQQTDAPATPDQSGDSITAPDLTAADHDTAAADRSSAPTASIDAGPTSTDPIHARLTSAVPTPAEASPEVTSAVHAACDAARVAQRDLATLPTTAKDELLLAMADDLVAAAGEIVTANAEDMERADTSGMAAGLKDRLRLTPERVAGIAQQLRDVAALPDPVGRVLRGSTLPNGLRLQQVAVPFGVIGMIYEARPNVTVDAAALTLKSGNAVILRGGSAAASSNTALIAVLRRTLTRHGLSEDLIAGIDQHGRAGVSALLRARGHVDLVIPRGGAGLIRAVVENAQVPVIETGTGNCHIFVDESADLAGAVDIIENAKVQRCGVCNAVETVLVHEAVATDVLRQLAERLGAAGVTLHADPAARSALGQQADVMVQDATEEDWATEYLSLDLAVTVVPSLEAAIEHIRSYSSGHTETILTNDLGNSQRFSRALDAAVIMVNASPRFSDGGEFGFGTEIGISTQKLHARGPMALPELTTTTWIVHGEGHIRA